MHRKERGTVKKIAWGLFLLLTAGLILLNSFVGFVSLTLFSIIFAAIALVFLFHCLMNLSFATLPIPLATLYYIFQPQLEELFPGVFPEVRFWILVVVTLLITCGLHAILPRRFSSGKYINIGVESARNRKSYSRNRYDSRGNVKVQIDDDVNVIIDGNGNYENIEGFNIEQGDDANNPYISVSFGHASRYLHADCLKTAQLNCSFGGMEVYFDQVTLSPEGAELEVNCSFGSIEIFVPSHWRVIDDMNSSLANTEVSRRLTSNGADAPTLRVFGSVSLGNVEVRRIKGSD